MDRQWIEELLSKTDLVALISRYVPLKKKGRTYWGCCPFHHEKEPSFAVNEEKQFYHCFGCKASGNAISFIEKMESIDFLDAVKMLADEHHMTLPKFEGKNEEFISLEKKDRLYSLMREAARHYHENLLSGHKNAVLAADYLKRRGVSQKLITKFGMGVSLGGKEIINYLCGKGYQKSEIKEAGIAEQKADDYYDVFYDRLMIPIIDTFGQVVAFGGRLIDPGTHIPVKYRNSSATPIFDKSKTLYALNLVKKKKQKEMLSSIIITEGYMDVISLFGAGFENAIASMGTSLTFKQAKQIKNYCDRVYICYDGDSAGQTATLRGLDILSAAGLNVKVISLPDELDPDDFIKANGAKQFQKLIDEAVPLPTFKIRSAAKKYDLTSPDEKAKFAIEAVKVIKALDNPIEQEEYLKDINKFTGYSIDSLKKQADITALDLPVYDESPKPQKTDDENADKAELFVVAALLHGADYAELDEDIFTFLKSPIAKELYSYYIEKKKQGGKVNLSALYTVTDGAESFVEYSFVPGDDRNKFSSCLKQLKNDYYKQRKIELAKKFDETKDIKLLNELIGIDVKLKEINGGGQ